MKKDKLVYYSYTVSYDRNQGYEVQGAIQKLIDRVAIMTLLFGIPFDLAVDQMDFEDNEALARWIKKSEDGDGVPNPKNMKPHHDTLTTWAAFFSKKRLKRIKRKKGA